MSVLLKYLKEFHKTVLFKSVKRMKFRISLLGCLAFTFPRGIGFLKYIRAGQFRERGTEINSKAFKGLFVISTHEKMMIKLSFRLLSINFYN